MVCHGIERSVTMKHRILNSTKAILTVLRVCVSPRSPKPKHMGTRRTVKQCQAQKRELPNPSDYKLQKLRAIVRRLVSCQAKPGPSTSCLSGTKSPFNSGQSTLSFPPIGGLVVQGGFPFTLYKKQRLKSPNHLSKPPIRGYLTHQAPNNQLRVNRKAKSTSNRVINKTRYSNGPSPESW